MHLPKRGVLAVLTATFLLTSLAGCFDGGGRGYRGGGGGGRDGGGGGDGGGRRGDGGGGDGYNYRPATHATRAVAFYGLQPRKT